MNNLKLTKEEKYNINLIEKASKFYRCYLQRGHRRYEKRDWTFFLEIHNGRSLQDMQKPWNLYG